MYLRVTAQPECVFLTFITVLNSSALDAHGNDLANATLETEQADTFGRIVAKLWNSPTQKVKQNLRITFSSSERKFYLRLEHVLTYLF